MIFFSQTMYALFQAQECKIIEKLLDDERSHAFFVQPCYTCRTNIPFQKKLYLTHSIFTKVFFIFVKYTIETIKQLKRF